MDFYTKEPVKMIENIRLKELADTQVRHTEEISLISQRLADATRILAEHKVTVDSNHQRQESLEPLVTQLLNEKESDYGYVHKSCPLDPAMKPEMESPNDEEMLKKCSIYDEEEDGDDEEPIQEDVSDEEEEEEQEPMTLGFSEKPKNKWSLLRQYFPSKAGGTPAWLDPVNLSSDKSSCCGFCGEPMQFLLQVYAQLSEGSTFHRTLFVFMCRSMACFLRDQHEQWKRQSGTQCRSVKVFRCQLPRVNSFYSSKTPVDDGSAQPLIPGALLCYWCGIWKGHKICSSCKRARYCSAKHQSAHWKSTIASHKLYCRKLEARGETSVSAAANSIWPEYEIINEDECELGDSKMPNNNESANSLIPRNQVHDSIAKIESIVNEQIQAVLDVFSKETKLADAKRINFLRAVFGEVYPDPVSVVAIGKKVDDLVASPENEELVTSYFRI